MKNHTKTLHKIGEYIRINISEIEGVGLTLIELKLSILRELITHEEKRTGIESFLFIYQYQLSDKDRQKYESIIPLTVQEKRILAACAIITNALNIGDNVPYSIEYIKALCEYIVDEISTLTLPDDVS